MDGGDRILVAAGLTAAVVVGAFVLWGPGGAPKVRKRRGQIAGLQNLGRTCFLNTMLQALAACPTFIEWLRKYAKSDGPNSMITTLYTVIEVVNGTHESARGTPVCPLGVLQALRAAGWVVPADQQDAHELLHVLLSCIEEETQAMSKKPGCLSDALGLGGSRAWSALASPASPPSLSLTSSREEAPARPARPASAAPPGEPELINHEEMPGKLSRGVSRSFCHLGALSRRWAGLSARPPPAPPTRGTLATRTVCTVCSYKSPVRYDKFDSISLSMANASTNASGAYSLNGLLRAFTAPEIVKGVRCTKCSPDDAPKGEPAYTRHIRTVSFGKLPAVLVLHVARVEWRGGGPSKRAEHVAFPELLSLAPYTAPRTQTSLRRSRRRLRARRCRWRARRAGRARARRARAHSSGWRRPCCTWAARAPDTSPPTAAATASRASGGGIPRTRSSTRCRWRRCSAAPPTCCSTSAPASPRPSPRTSKVVPDPRLGLWRLSYPVVCGTCRVSPQQCGTRDYTLPDGLKV